ncbi:hypothetical protein [Pleomorphovibrio marinus]|uniref:hypothetical protein n=1 Tax=Pleomorphovibrio marinus TaxID=2164132 RepID=UPI000E0BDDDC|nr:hypothetical protein [Pleomorphovibrio marinus]
MILKNLNILELKAIKELLSKKIKVVQEVIKEIESGGGGSVYAVFDYEIEYDHMEADLVEYKKQLENLSNKSKIVWDEINSRLENIQ